LLSKDSSFKAKSLKATPAAWRALVDEVVASNTVKNILEYRRKAAGKKAEKMSPTELMLSFLQSRVDMQKLEQLNILRSKRAAARTKGDANLA
jgi:hypothetical protein